MCVMVVFSASAAATALPPSGPSLLDIRLQKEEERERVEGVSVLVILNIVHLASPRREDNCTFKDGKCLRRDERT